MKINLLIEAISHLKARQIAYQVIYRIFRAKYRYYKLSDFSFCTLTPSIAKYTCCKNDKFEFLNLSKQFSGWNDTANGMLWAYNLNYMDWLNQKGYLVEEGIQWIDRFIADLHANRVGLDPYPIALRGMNWIKFIVRNSAEIPQEKLQKWLNSLYSQYRLLEKKLEYHLLGNHLLEDAYSLYFASVFFRDDRMFRKAARLLKRELEEQVLPDGAHYEQSPMYHCILLDRLLDCYNISANNLIFEEQNRLNEFMEGKAAMMLGHLESVIWSDGDIPLLNDSAFRIAPRPLEIFEYAKRLSLVWSKIPLKECGYRKFRNNRIESIVDVGDIMAQYQPGHTHSDLFNYEILIDGKPFIVDTGVSTYNKTDRRQYERSSKAHNTLVINNTDCYQVWGGFRVGKRVHSKIIKDGESVSAQYKIHNAVVRRSFSIDSDTFKINDCIEGRIAFLCESYIHFADDIRINSADNNIIKTSRGDILLSGVESVTIHEDYISSEYNLLQKSEYVSIIPKHSPSWTCEISYVVVPNKR